MLIEKIGFYLTREGKLRLVVSILSDLFEVPCPIIAVNADGEPDRWRVNGSYRDTEILNKLDLFRYLPTVTSFSDPIPPEPEPPKTKTLTNWLCRAVDGCGFYAVWRFNRPDNAIEARETTEVPE